MPKMVANVVMFQSGDPAGGPSDVMFTYDVCDGPAVSEGKVYHVEEPDHEKKSPKTLWADAVKAIKTAEGIK